LLAVRGAGAYAASMGSNYNSRPRPPEVLVDGESWIEVRTRQRVEDLWRDE
jgi:diaminopimelate decarboxylase